MIDIPNLELHIRERPDWLPKKWIFLPDVIERFGRGKYGEIWTGNESKAYARLLVNHGQENDQAMLPAYDRWLEAMNFLREQFYSGILDFFIFDNGSIKKVSRLDIWGDIRACSVLLLTGKPYLGGPQIENSSVINLGLEADFWRRIIGNPLGSVPDGIWMVAEAKQIDDFLGKNPQRTDNVKADDFVDLPFKRDALEAWNKLKPKIQMKYRRWYKSSQEIKQPGDSSVALAKRVAFEYWEGRKYTQGCSPETIKRTLNRFFISWAEPLRSQGKTGMPK
jgi:hypothetical protein